MNVVIFGAGASFATHALPMTTQALQSWSGTIEQAHPLLALALDWVAPKWREAGVNLEEAWQWIDIAWKERGILGIARRVDPLNLAQRRQVWELAEAEQRREEGRALVLSQAGGGSPSSAMVHRAVLERRGGLGIALPHPGEPDDDRRPRKVRAV